MELLRGEIMMKGNSGELRPGSWEDSYMYGYKQGERGSTEVRERAKHEKNQGPRNQGGLIRGVSC